jgi:tryptophan synthase beta chain
MKNNNHNDKKKFDKKAASDSSDAKSQKNSDLPVDGYFGQFGGQHVSDALLAPLQQLEEAFLSYRDDDNFLRDLRVLLADYGGRPTSLYFARRLTRLAGGARIYLKREDLLHGGVHLINNAFGQGLLAKRMGKKRLIADTSSGDNGIAIAKVAIVLGLEAHIYMGQADWEHQQLKVDRMKMMGAKIHPVQMRRSSPEDANSEAWKDWSAHHDTSHYLVGSAVGPHPYPQIVRDFQRIIGDEIKGQILRKERRLPDLVVAPLGGGSCAIGSFYPFLDEEFVQFVAVEAGGQSGESMVRARNGKIEIYHGMKGYVLQNDGGSVRSKNSIANGLAYPALGPEHSYYCEQGRIESVSVTDQQALEGAKQLIETEGIIVSLESAHAIFIAMERAKQLGSDGLLVVTVPGRGDKDFEVISRHFSSTVQASQSPSVTVTSSSGTSEKTQEQPAPAQPSASSEQQQRGPQQQSASDQLRPHNSQRKSQHQQRNPQQNLTSEQRSSTESQKQVQQERKPEQQPVRDQSSSADSQKRVEQQERKPEQQATRDQSHSNESQKRAEQQERKPEQQPARDQSSSADSQKRVEQQQRNPEQRPTPGQSQEREKPLEQQQNQRQHRQSSPDRSRSSDSSTSSEHRKRNPEQRQGNPQQQTDSQRHSHKPGEDRNIKPSGEQKEQTSDKSSETTQSNQDQRPFS